VVRTLFSLRKDYTMKVAISLGAPYAADIKEIQLENQMIYVVEAESLGTESVSSAEAWGHDAITPLAYLAARTSRIRLGTGIMQIGARTPAMIAMTALTMRRSRRIVLSWV